MRTLELLFVALIAFCIPFYVSAACADGYGPATLPSTGPSAPPVQCRKCADDLCADCSTIYSSCTSCQTGTGVRSTDSRCYYCADQYCAACAADTTVCTSCVNGFKSVNGKCVASCNPDCDASSELCVGPNKCVCDEDRSYTGTAGNCKLRPKVGVVSIGGGAKKRANIDSASAARRQVGISGSGFVAPVTVSVGGINCVIKSFSATAIQCTLEREAIGYNLAIVVSANGASADAYIASSRIDIVPSTITAADTPCGLYGTKDINGFCNCWSGYGPTNTDQFVDCGKHAICPGISVPLNHMMPVPKQPKVTFTGDRLHIKQSVPIIHELRNVDILFKTPKTGTSASVRADVQCYYPGPIWQKSLNNLDCVDEYTADLAWSQHGMCGFTDTSTPADQGVGRKVLQAELAIYQTTLRKKANGKFATSVFSTNHLVTVKFEGRLTVLASPITVNAIGAGSTSPNVDITSSAVFDTVTQDVTVSFSTDIAFPYNIPTLTGIWARATSNLDQSSAVATVAFTMDTTSGPCAATLTSCVQNWKMVLTPLTLCNVEGAVTITSGNLQCRDLPVDASGNFVACNPTQTSSFTIDIGKTSICAAAALDTSLNIAKSIKAYSDNGFANEESSFQIGDTVNMQIIINDPVSSIDQVTYSSIGVSTSATTIATGGVLLFSSAVGGASPPSSPISNLVDYRQADLSNPVPAAPGQNITVSFTIVVNRATLQSANGGTAPASPTSLYLQATLDVMYHGNNGYRKRTINALAPADTHTATILLTFSESEDGEELTEDTQEDLQAEEWEWDYSSSAARQTTAFLFLFSCLVALALF